MYGRLIVYNAGMTLYSEVTVWWFENDFTFVWRTFLRRSPSWFGWWRSWNQNCFVFLDICTVFFTTEWVNLIRLKGERNNKVERANRVKINLGSGITVFTVVFRWSLIAIFHVFSITSLSLLLLCFLYYIKVTQSGKEYRTQSRYKIESYRSSWLAWLL